MGGDALGTPSLLLILPVAHTLAAARLLGRDRDDHLPLLLGRDLQPLDDRLVAKVVPGVPLPTHKLDRLAPRRPPGTLEDLREIGAGAVFVPAARLLCERERLAV